MQKCGRALAPRDQKLIFLRLSELVVAFAQFAKKSEKTVVTLWILRAKNLFFSVTRWLSLYRSLPSMLQLYPASNSYFMTSQLLFWNVFLEILWANSVHIKSFSIICGCFYWARSKYWEVKSINCWGCIVFRHCQGKNSRETIRCTYQAKLNQH